MKAWPVLSLLLITTGKLIVLPSCVASCGCLMWKQSSISVNYLQMRLICNHRTLLIVVFNANNLFISLSALFFSGIETRQTDLSTIFITYLFYPFHRNIDGWDEDPQKLLKYYLNKILVGLDFWICLEIFSGHPHIKENATWTAVDITGQTLFYYPTVMAFHLVSTLSTHTPEQVQRCPALLLTQAMNKNQITFNTFCQIENQILTLIRSSLAIVWSPLYSSEFGGPVAFSFTKQYSTTCSRSKLVSTQFLSSSTSGQQSHHTTTLHHKITSHHHTTPPTTPHHHTGPTPQLVPPPNRTNMPVAKRPTTLFHICQKRGKLLFIASMSIASMSIRISISFKEFGSS